MFWHPPKRAQWDLIILEVFSYLNDSVMLFRDTVSRHGGAWTQWPLVVFSNLHDSMKFRRVPLLAYHTGSSTCPIKLKRIAAVLESHRLSLCAWKSSVILKPAGTGTPWSAGPGDCMQHWGWSPQRAWECWGMWWLKSVKAVPRSILTLCCCKLPCCSARSTPGHDSIHSYRQI